MCNEMFDDVDEFMAQVAVTSSLHGRPALFADGIMEVRPAPLPCAEPYENCGFDADVNGWAQQANRLVDRALGAYDSVQNGCMFGTWYRLPDNAGWALVARYVRFGYRWINMQWVSGVYPTLRAIAVDARLYSCHVIDHTDEREVTQGELESLYRACPGWQW